MRILLWCVGLLLARPAHADPVSADDAVRSALRLHPAAVSATADADAARRARREVPLGDPSISAARTDVWEVELEVPIPLGAVASSRAAARTARAASLAADRAALEAAADARFTWAAAAAARDAVALGDAALSWATGVRQATEARAAAGDAAPLDVALARGAEATAAARAIAARRDAAAASVALAALIPGAKPEDLRGAPSDAVTLPATLGGDRADVAAAEARVGAARAVLSAARADSVPAPIVGIKLEGDAVGPLVGWTIPLFHRGQRARGAAAADLAVATADAERLRAGAAAEQDVTADLLAWSATVPVPAIALVEALAAVDAAVAAGELDLADAVVLRGALVDGALSAVQAELDLVRIRLDALLAAGDAHLLPEDLR